MDIMNNKIQVRNNMYIQKDEARLHDYLKSTILETYLTTQIKMLILRIDKKMKSVYTSFCSQLNSSICWCVGKNRS